MNHFSHTSSNEGVQVTDGERLFQKLCGCHGGHGCHGDGGHGDISEDGLAGARGGHLVFAQSPDDHLTHFSAGIAANRQQSLDVLLPTRTEGTEAQFTTLLPLAKKKMEICELQSADIDVEKGRR